MKNIWKSLLVNLLISNVVMVMIWLIILAFGYKPHYWLSLTINNVITVLLWALRSFGGRDGC